MFKAGFVSIIGKPNTGKSTLVNALTGEKLCIVTSKAQTTRHRITCIVNAVDYQIVFSDTPGIISPSYKMQECMMSYVNSSFRDSDVIIYLTDVTEKPAMTDILEKISSSGQHVIFALNKIDTTGQDAVQALLDEWKKVIPEARQIAISAMHKFNIDSIMSMIVSLLPEHEPYYETDAITVHSTRFFISEIIREKILLLYQNEIPYSVEIEVTEFIESDNLIRILANIYVMKDTQRGIILGEGGRMIKKMGTKSRLDIEKFTGKKVFLKLFVKVLKDWRRDVTALKRFGYIIK